MGPGSGADMGAAFFSSLSSVFLAGPSLVLPSPRPDIKSASVSWLPSIEPVCLFMVWFGLGWGDGGGDKDGKRGEVVRILYCKK